MWNRRALVYNLGISNVLSKDTPSQIHTLLSWVPIGIFILINISWLPLPSVDICVEASMIPHPYTPCIVCPQLQYGPFGFSSPRCSWIAECGKTGCLELSVQARFSDASWNVWAWHTPEMPSGMFPVVPVQKQLALFTITLQSLAAMLSLLQLQT